MVNEDHDPSDEEETILAILQDGRYNDEPWGFTAPRVLKRRGIPSPDYHLGQLETAGWITRVDHGFYRFVEDPREDDDQDQDQEQEQDQ